MAGEGVEANKEGKRGEGKVSSSTSYLLRTQCTKLLI